MPAARDPAMLIEGVTNRFSTQYELEEVMFYYVKMIIPTCSDVSWMMINDVFVVTHQ